jgi:omega-6 fatty acid desaturase (delta-12 desaturase)
MSSPETTASSIPPSVVPHRKVIRQWLTPLSAASTPRAMTLVAIDFALFAGLLAATVLAHTAWVQVLLAIAQGLVIGRLFILGHDACHQSLTAHRGLNRWVGRMLFLPSLTTYSIWEVGHNLVHHNHTNLRKFDYVWRPNSPEEFRALPAWRRGLERAYRSGWAPWLYYLVEIWWSRLLFPNRRIMPTRRPIFFRDSLLVSVFGLAWLGGLVAAAEAGGQSAAWLVLVGFVLPFLVWNGLIGFIVYVHHTHVEVDWYEDEQAWADAKAHVTTTVHLTFRSGFGTVIHNILEHTAHHVDMRIPLYRLRAAQAMLEEKLAGHITVQPFSWKWYFQTARKCKLYDYQARCWTDFAGRPSVVPESAPPAGAEVTAMQRGQASA